MFETLVIGAGQAGLAASYYLQRAGVPFAVVEAGNTPTGS
jgi:putative flavoprotein involved in K+ transport